MVNSAQLSYFFYTLGSLKAAFSLPAVLKSEGFSKDSRRNAGGWM